MRCSFSLKPLASQRCHFGRQSVDRVSNVRPQRLYLRRSCLRCSASSDFEEIKRVQDLMKSAMKDNPQLRERMNMMEEAMKNPLVKKQLEQTVAYMQSDEARAKIEALREDPDVKERFEEIEKGGFSAMMKAMGDEEFLRKVGQSIGPPSAMQTTTVPKTESAQDTQTTKEPTAPEPQVPRINNLLDAAKYGDIEAVEDFLAIGKDPNFVDDLNRSPLHFAVSIQHMEIIEALLKAGANIEIRDSKNNTPLHYAAGYGRVKAARRLLEAGANGSVRNDTGKTPADVAKLSDKNPLLQDEELMGQLKKMASVSET